MESQEGIESNPNDLEQPLTLQLAKESGLAIQKLRKLGLDDPSAPGMSVFGENGSQIAILHGKIPVAPAIEQEQVVEKYLIISPKGFFLAEGKSDVLLNEEYLLNTLRSIKNSSQESTNVSIEKNTLSIQHKGTSQKFKMEIIDSTPEKFTEMLRSAIESSRNIAQKPLKHEIALGKAGNIELDRMLSQSPPPNSPLTESGSAPPPPPTPPQP